MPSLRPSRAPPWACRRRETRAVPSFPFCPTRSTETSREPPAAWGPPVTLYPPSPLPWPPIRPIAWSGLPTKSSGRASKLVSQPAPTTSPVWSLSRSARLERKVAKGSLHSPNQPWTSSRRPSRRWIAARRGETSGEWSTDGIVRHTRRRRHVSLTGLVVPCRPGWADAALPWGRGAHKGRGVLGEGGGGRVEEVAKLHPYDCETWRRVQAPALSPPVLACPARLQRQLLLTCLLQYNSMWPTAGLAGRLARWQAKLRAPLSRRSHPPRPSSPHALQPHHQAPKAKEPCGDQSLLVGSQAGGQAGRVSGEGGGGQEAKVRMGMYPSHTTRTPPRTHTRTSTNPSCELVELRTHGRAGRQAGRREGPRRGAGDAVPTLHAAGSFWLASGVVGELNKGRDGGGGGGGGWLADPPPKPDGWEHAGRVHTY